MLELHRGLQTRPGDLGWGRTCQNSDPWDITQKGEVGSWALFLRLLHSLYPSPGLPFSRAMRAMNLGGFAELREVQEAASPELQCVTGDRLSACQD